METLQDLRRKVDTTRSLQSVVKTMKALAAVSIRQYERATESLDDYRTSVERGLQALLAVRPGGSPVSRSAEVEGVGAVVFGSDQGMCGPLNDRIVEHARATLRDRPAPRVLVVGSRAAARLEDAGFSPDEVLAVPESAEAITERVQELLVHLGSWERRRRVQEISLFYSVHESGASYRPHEERILPMDEAWLAGLREREWPTNRIPLITADWEPLFSAYVREYLFVSLFRALAESLASEHASRLASMQSAERNVEERLDDLGRRYHQRRQMEITEELLDILAGSEVAREGRAGAS